MMNRLIYHFSQYLKEHYPFRVRKLPIHTHLGCPHRDPATGLGGCDYCYNPGFSRISTDFKPVNEQIQTSITQAREKNFTGKFIAYFQTETNTNTELATLQKLWEPVRQFKNDFIGLSISTRPDAINKETLELLDSFSKGFTVWLEIGLQSAHSRTLEAIHRGHSFEDFLYALDLASQFIGIRKCIHLIIGLPGETIEDYKETLIRLNSLPIHGLKLHHLQIIKNTVFAQRFKQGEISVFDEDQYLGILLELIPFISSEWVIHRLFGNIRSEYLIAPQWKTPKTRLIQSIESSLISLNQFQGSAISAGF